jgi:hypothetical protein
MCTTGQLYWGPVGGGDADAWGFPSLPTAVLSSIPLWPKLSTLKHLSLAKVSQSYHYQHLYAQDGYMTGEDYMEVCWMEA